MPAYRKATSLRNLEYSMKITIPLPLLLALTPAPLPEGEGIGDEGQDWTLYSLDYS
jgi:hypothetical protein